MRGLRKENFRSLQQICFRFLEIQLHDAVAELTAELWHPWKVEVTERKKVGFAYDRRKWTGGGGGLVEMANPSGTLRQEG